MMAEILCRPSRSAWIFLALILIGLQTARAVCPSGCDCDDETLHVNCVEANLDFVPITLNPLVQKLLLRNNRIRSVETGFGFYHELNFVDLSHNHLLKIAPGSFSAQSKLNELHLNNNKITTLSNYTFGGTGGGFGGGGGSHRGLTSLIHLNLRVNLLESIEPGIFLNTQSLQELDLGQNSLKDFERGVVSGLEALRILRLDHNDLREVPEVFGALEGHHGNLFQEEVPLYHLVELFMGMNPIEVINGGAFEGLPHLAVLDLKGSQLRVLHSEAFSGLGQLKKLILSDNNLKAVPSWAFGTIRQLEVLRIGRNPISNFGGASFRGLPVLKVLEMSGAPELVSVEQDSFAFNLDLEVVEISSAKLLTSLPPKLFNGISSLRSLTLKENALKGLPEDLASWQSLRALQLQGNPFTCSCDMSWLRDLLDVTPFRNNSFLVLCDGPLDVQGRRVSDLSDKDLNCSAPTPWQQTLLGVTVAVVMLLLIVFFFLLYRFHDRIKASWKRNCGRRGGRAPRPCGPSSVAVKASEMDTSTKTSFLSHQSAYAYSDEEFALRASLMSTPNFSNGAPPSQNGGYQNGSAHAPTYYAHALNPTTLQRQYSNHGYPTQYHQPISPHGHPNGSFFNYGEAEYETPLNLGLAMFTASNSNNHYASAGDHNPQVTRPVPITEL